MYAGTLNIWNVFLQLLNDSIYVVILPRNTTDLDTFWLF